MDVEEQLEAEEATVVRSQQFASSSQGVEEETIVKETVTRVEEAGLSKSHISQNMDIILLPYNRLIFLKTIFFVQRISYINFPITQISFKSSLVTTTTTTTTTTAKLSRDEKESDSDYEREEHKYSAEEKRISASSYSEDDHQQREEEEEEEVVRTTTTTTKVELVEEQLEGDPSEEFRTQRRMSTPPPSPAVTRTSSEAAGTYTYTKNCILKNFLMLIDLCRCMGSTLYSLCVKGLSS